MKQKSKNLTYGLLAIFIAVITGCNNINGQKTENNIASSTEWLASPEVSNLLSVNCYTCHNPNASSHDEIIAPPLTGVKMRYKNATKDREEFIVMMSTYVSNPNEARALMKGPVKRFGVMPKTALDEDEIKKIVTYIFDNDIPEPSWFKEHTKEKHNGRNNK